MKNSKTVLLVTVSSALLLFACGKTNFSQNPQSSGQPVSYVYQHPEQVQAVICPDGNQGIVICHYPPGNPLNAQTLCVGAAAVPAHVMHHGDTLGVCGAFPASPTPAGGPLPSPSSSPNVG